MSGFAQTQGSQKEVACYNWVMKIIVVGKKNSDYVAVGIETFSKRLQGAWKPEWLIIPSSAQKAPETAKNDESERILARIKPSEFVILLDEAGRMLDSPAASELLTEYLSDVVLVIGGAYGVNEQLKARANVIWSLSKLVFPHQLVRLILTEQIYRAWAINQNHPYHHA